MKRESHRPSGNNWVLTVEYDGTMYAGFQRQRNRPSVQETLEFALERAVSHPVRLTAAGRTDTGVHALGQVINFRSAAALDADRIVQGGNYYLPADVRIINARVGDPEFDARRSAVRRAYRYRILNRPVASPLLRVSVHHVPQPLQIEPMREAALDLLGRHDFCGLAAVTNYDRSTVREVYEAHWEADGDLLDFWIVANAFLQHQVRTIVGTMLDIGRGKRPPTVISEILKTGDRRLAGATAPPQGLCLMRVHYPEEWE